MKQKIYKESTNFQKLIFIQKKNPMSSTKTIICIFYNSLQKKISKIHSYGKKKLGKKTCNSFQTNVVGLFYLICAHRHLQTILLISWILILIPSSMAPWRMNIGIIHNIAKPNIEVDLWYESFKL
jgi:hypothetical protein